MGGGCGCWPPRCVPGRRQELAWSPHPPGHCSKDLSARQPQVSPDLCAPAPPRLRPRLPLRAAGGALRALPLACLAGLLLGAAIVPPQVEKYEVKNLTKVTGSGREGRL